MAFLLLFRLRELLSFSFSQVEVHGLRPAAVQLSFLVGVHLSRVSGTLPMRKATLC